MYKVYFCLVIKIWVMQDSNVYDNIKFNFSYTGKSEKITLPPGVYKFECWGAQGYTSLSYESERGGKGAYVKGILRNKIIQNFFIFVGQYGKAYSPNYSFNGGGYSQYSGGGASDVRLVNGTWDDFESLKSRIIVAAGGGGPDSGQNGGAGGTLDGISTEYGEGGKQTRGGYGIGNGTFGKGGFYPVLSSDGCGAGGGGYYGGGTSKVATDYAGSGGSSFISGYPGCDAILEESTEDEIKHKGTSKHYSGLTFSSAVMIDGNSLMPSPINSSTQIGNEFNGFVIITVLTRYNECTCRLRSRSISFVAQVIIICTY